MSRKRKKARQGKQAAKPVTQHPGLEVVEPTPEFQAKHPLEKVKTDQGSHTKRVRNRRPIDDYHRMYCIDRDRGIGEQYRRGISEDQFRAADRLSCNYERTFHKLSMPLDGIRVESSINVGMYPTESIMHAIHQHTRVMKELSRVSQEIVEAICCEESGIVDYEQAHRWYRGYGITRLREALDELVEAYRRLSKRESKRSHPFA